MTESGPDMDGRWTCEMIYSSDLTPLDYFLWGYTTLNIYADKKETIIQYLEINIPWVITEIHADLLRWGFENWISRLQYKYFAHEAIYQKLYLNIKWHNRIFVWRPRTSMEDKCRKSYLSNNNKLHNVIFVMVSNTWALNFYFY